MIMMMETVDVEIVICKYYGIISTVISMYK